MFVGYLEVFDNCDGSSHRIVQLEANPRTGAFLAEVVVGLLSSFNIAGDSITPATSTASAQPASTPRGAA